MQRVLNASVEIDGASKASIGSGLLVLLGIEMDDGPDDVSWLCGKLTQLRIFDDENGVMNRSVMETGGEVLLISQFTLHASTRKGNRPSWIRAAKPEQAVPLYEQFIEELARLLGKSIATGVFGADMKVSLVNDGPVTLILDSRNKE